MQVYFLRQYEVNKPLNFGWWALRMVNLSLFSTHHIRQAVYDYSYGTAFVMATSLLESIRLSSDIGVHSLC